MADSLALLRRSIASSTLPILSSSSTPVQAAEATDDLAKATHLQFSEQSEQIFPLNGPTRFILAEKPVDLRSIFFAWLKKDVAIPDYISSTQELNTALNGASTVRNLVFVERLDLITWLEGASEESEYIQPLESDKEAVAQAAKVVSGAAGGVSSAPSGTAGTRQGKQIDPRLQEIYNGERRMGDRNTVLRGIRPTDFSHVRKHAEIFLKSRNNRSNGTATSSAAASTNPSSASSSIPSHPKKPSRRPDPIILLSPSASSLLRMSNIKSFLESGVYIPPDSSLAGSSGQTATILHLTRLLPSIEPHRPLRFILVDTPEQFKPDYWSRVVAVLTTGQTWQFKSYKWQTAPELFKNVLGVYVGWRGEDVPATVKGWGRGVQSVGVEKWNPTMGTQGRWRDREVVEAIWGRVEESMRARGWGKEGGPAGGR